jgi:uncharacterized protein (UPF0335 family)
LHHGLWRVGCPDYGGERLWTSAVALDPARRIREPCGSLEIRARSIRMVDTQSVAADQLKAIIERVERLEEEKKALSDDIKDVYAEAKANGFDTKVLRKIISLRKQDRDQRMEEEAILELYKQALGMA